MEPRAAKCGITVLGDTLKVKLTSAPVDGAANKQLVELLAKELGVRKSSVKVLRGEKSKNKVIKIEDLQGL